MRKIIYQVKASEAKWTLPWPSSASFPVSRVTEKHLLSVESSSWARSAFWCISKESQTVPNARVEKERNASYLYNASLVTSRTRPPAQLIDQVRQLTNPRKGLLKSTEMRIASLPTPSTTLLGPASRRRSLQYCNIDRRGWFTGLCRAWEK